MAIALTGDQMAAILSRARQIQNADDRQRFFDGVASALRDLDPPIGDHTVRRAAVDAFLPFNLARTPRAKTQ